MGRVTSWTGSLHQPLPCPAALSFQVHFLTSPPDLGGECGPLDQHSDRCLHPLWAVGPGHPLSAGPSAPGRAEHPGQVLLLPGETPSARLPPGEGFLRHERDEAEWGGWWGRSRWRARAMSGCGRARKVKGRSLAAARPPPPWVLMVAGSPPPDGTAACHLQHPGQQWQHRLLAALLLQGQVAA